MKKFILVIGALLLLAGCGASVKAEDLISESYAKKDEVENYYIDTEMTINLDAAGIVDKSEASFKGDIDEAGNKAHVKNTETANNQKQEAEFVFYEKVQYLKNNNQWQAIAEYDQISRAGTTYYAIIKAVRDFDEFAESQTKDKPYTATYEGEGADIFYVFEDVFNLSLTGFDLEDDTRAEVAAEFDPDTLYLTSLLIKIFAENEQGEADFTIEVEFKDINDTEVDIPEEL